ncbi:class II fructose-bisphosphate aldolase [Microbacterium sp. STN6]|uniref:class II fructose-bisphosphate aldolase n=1 Tax=Microbacterium sp. STN6 TaxID=2995588 RepID=UPI002260D01C|nr:class II fructose-bisphosphate aldolase [Microbacterium sp. STN6]MCX7523343.1 class II fructose-bisphosphate aldolase [Microbacterium sp. STN6]
MSAVSTRHLVDEAVVRGTAVLGFNVITLEHAEGIVAGAERAGTGVLLQLSENAVVYHGRRMRPLVAACRELAAAASVPVALHLDHVREPALIDETIDLGSAAGIGSIMIDASTLPYDENVRATTEAAVRARAAGLWVEAELGEVGGKDGAHAPGVRTDPREAAAFVAATGVDGLAVAVGSSHAMTTRTAHLDLELIARLAAAVPVPLVLHGSSGVADDDLRRAVAAGIRKVNVGTALNVVWSAEVRRVLDGDAALTDPRRYLGPAREAVAELVEHLCGVIAVPHRVSPGLAAVDGLEGYSRDTKL